MLPLVDSVEHPLDLLVLLLGHGGLALHKVTKADLEQLELVLSLNEGSL